jgi:hypothetical protein
LTAGPNITTKKLPRSYFYNSTKNDPYKKQPRRRFAKEMFCRGDVLCVRPKIKLKMLHGWREEREGEGMDCGIAQFDEE